MVANWFLSKFVHLSCSTRRVVREGRGSGGKIPQGFEKVLKFARVFLKMLFF